MKLSNETLDIFENFSTINPNIIVRPGKQLRTISATKAVFAVADVEDEFETQFAINDLRKFIGCLSLFDEAELEFGEKCVTIAEGEQELSYYYADAEHITGAPEKTIKLPSEDVKFKLTTADYQKIVKAMAVAGLSYIAVVGDGKKLMLRALDPEGKLNDSFTINVDKSNLKFKAVFRAENMKIIPGDYDVTICSKGIASFVGKNIQYFIASEEKYSKF